MEEPTEFTNASREEIMTMLFKQLVMQQTNMALMFLGAVPHPETGEHLRDPESAKLYLDQLEMLEHHTRGNLNEEEDAWLRKSLAKAKELFVASLDEEDGIAPPTE
ncbi:MAG: DUF1844 domain-containing protein [Limisphaerales bacterium]